VSYVEYLPAVTSRRRRRAVSPRPLPQDVGGDSADMRYAYRLFDAAHHGGADAPDISRDELAVLRAANLFRLVQIQRAVEPLRIENVNLQIPEQFSTDPGETPLYLNAVPDLPGLRVSLRAFSNAQYAPPVIRHDHGASYFPSGSSSHGTRRIGIADDGVDLATEATERESGDSSILRVGGLVGLGVIFASIALLLLSVGAGLVGMYVGLSIFAFSNYAAARYRQPYIIGPAVASLVTVGSFMLAIVSLVATVM
jgi:hypothetical protein